MRIMPVCKNGTIWQGGGFPVNTLYVVERLKPSATHATAYNHRHSRLPRREGIAAKSPRKIGRLDGVLLQGA